MNMAAHWYREGVGDCDIEEVGVRCYVGWYCTGEVGIFQCGVGDEGVRERGRVAGHGEVEVDVAPCKELLRHSDRSDVGTNWEGEGSRYIHYKYCIQLYIISNIYSTITELHYDSKNCGQSWIAT